MALKLITSPEEKLVSLELAKQFLRIDHDDEDAILNVMIGAAEEVVAKLTNRAFGVGTWELVLDEFPDEAIQLPIAPLLDVVGLYYFDNEGDEQTVDTDDYYVDDRSAVPWIVPTTNGWPSPILDAINAVRLRFRAGYPGLGESPPQPETDAPKGLVLAVLQLISHWYETREPVSVGMIVSTIPLTLETIISRYRLYL